MTLNNLRISAQVYLGFGLVLALLVLLAGTSWVGFSALKTEFQNFAGLNDRSSQLAKVVDEWNADRIRVLQFENNPSPERKAAAEKSMAETEKSFNLLAAQVTDPDRVAQVKALGEGLARYEESFANTSATVERREKAAKALFQGGSALNDQLRELEMQVTARAPHLSGQLSRAVESMLLTRLQVARFIAGRHEDDYRAAREPAERTAQLLSSLATQVNDGGLRDGLAKASQLNSALLAGLEDFHGAVVHLTDLTDKRTQFLAAFAEDVVKLRASYADESKALQGSAAAAIATSTTVVAGVAVAAILLGALAALLLGRRISNPLSVVSQAIAEVSRQKDLMQRVDYLSANEIGEISKSFNALMAVLHDAMEGIAGNTRQVAAAAGQASTAVGQVSDGSQSQLNAINQISAAMEQTTKAINDVASNSDQANRFAKQAATMVQHGREKMNTMVEVANVISENSKKINQITEVISRIANQTNMLSLNAAIEAARAGEHGKGFAVVAEEVRKLAENAATSVQQISELVEHAANEAGRSLEMVQAVNGDMEAIAESVRQTDGMIQSIAAAMTQQSSSAAEINANIKSLSKIGETNAAAAEEITATMVELARLADQTRSQTEQFRL